MFKSPEFKMTLVNDFYVIYQVAILLWWIKMATWESVLGYFLLVFVGVLVKNSMISLLNRPKVVEKIENVGGFQEKVDFSGQYMDENTNFYDFNDHWSDN